MSWEIKKNGLWTPIVVTPHQLAHDYPLTVYRKAKTDKETANPFCNNGVRMIVKLKKAYDVRAYVLYDYQKGRMRGQFKADFMMCVNFPELELYAESFGDSKTSCKSHLAYNLHYEYSKLCK
jgi:hypothetical protein